MRILYLATYFPRPGNPVMGVWALEQARALKAREPEMEVVVLNSWLPRVLARSSGRLAPWAACPPEYEWPGLKVSYLRWPQYHTGPQARMTYERPGPALGAAWRFVSRRLEGIASAHRPEVTYAHGTAVSGYVAHMLHRKLGIPYVTHDHDYEEVEDCRRLPHRRALYERVLNSGSAAITPSARMAAALSDLVPGCDARVVPTGAPLPAAQARPASRNSSPLVVFSAAMFYPRKGLPLLVRAFAESAPPDAVLRIAGDGEDRPAVEAAIRETGAGSRVHLLGPLAHEEVLREMADADLFALLGWDDPFPTVFSEAMACGTPVVCADDGGVADLIDDGREGRIVRARDLQHAVHVLKELFSRPEELSEMGIAARGLAESRLTWDHHAAAVLDILESSARPSLDRAAGALA